MDRWRWNGFRCVVLLVIGAATSLYGQESYPANRCVRGEHQCFDGTCVPKSWLCDKVKDCADGSDEYACDNSCSSLTFSCFQDGECISPLLVCNGTAECPNHSDEHEALCNEEQPHLYVAMGPRIAKVVPHREDYEGPSMVTVFDNEMNMDAASVGYSWKERAVVVADSKMETLFTLKNVKGRWVKKELINQDLKTVYGLAVDQASGNIYVADTERGVIEVVNSAGTARLVVVEHPVVEKPRGVAVDPSSGHLYFSDWEYNHQKIARCHLDGTNCVTLCTKLVAPSSIALDSKNGHLYYSDINDHKIGRMNLDGSAHTTVYTAPDKTQIFGVSVAADRCYWTDGLRSVLHTVDTATQKNEDQLVWDTKYFAFYGIVAVPPPFKDVENSCSRNNGGCSHLCFANPTGAVCKCPEWMYMDNNGKTCVDDPHFTKVQETLATKEPSTEGFWSAWLIGAAVLMVAVALLLLVIAVIFFTRLRAANRVCVEADNYTIKDKNALGAYGNGKGKTVQAANTSPRSRPGF